MAVAVIAEIGIGPQIIGAIGVFAGGDVIVVVHRLVVVDNLIIVAVCRGARNQGACSEAENAGGERVEAAVMLMAPVPHLVLGIAPAVVMNPEVLTARVIWVPIAPIADELLTHLQIG